MPNGGCDEAAGLSEQDDHAPSPDDGRLDDVAGLELTGEEGGENAIGGSEDPFFVSRQAAAVFKHKLLASYFPKFAGKAGSTETDRRLAYVDTHAGRGVYDDGTPGSPLLIARTALGMKEQRRIDCLFVERSPRNYKHLNEVLTQELGNSVTWAAVQGTAHDHLNRAIDFAGNSPLFMFVDPYGLGPSFHEVVRILQRKRAGFGQKTEVLLNFISGAFARAGAAANPEKDVRNREATLRHLDSVLGGPEWRDIYLTAETPAAAAAQIAKEYARSIEEVTGCRSSVIPVRNRAQREPVYWLVHFTFHPDGVYWMRESAGRASAEWRRHLSPPPKTHGELTLFDEDFDPFPAEEERRQAEWVNHIEENARALLAHKGTISVARDQRLLFGEANGLAWSTHLLKALQRVGRAGLLGPYPRSKNLEKYEGALVSQGEIESTG
jgi:three-Cys-motif partner protein